MNHYQSIDVRISKSYPNILKRTKFQIADITRWDKSLHLERIFLIHLHNLFTHVLPHSLKITLHIPKILFIFHFIMQT